MQLSRRFHRFIRFRQRKNDYSHLTRKNIDSTFSLSAHHGQHHLILGPLNVGVQNAKPDQNIPCLDDHKTR